MKHSRFVQTVFIIYFKVLLDKNCISNKPEVGEWNIAEISSTNFNTK